MEVKALSFRAPLADYRKQAEALLDAWNAGDPGAIETIRHKHPRFLDDEIRWLPKKLSDAEIRSVALDPADAELAIARWYDFDSWPRLEEFVDEVARGGTTLTFESAVEAVVDGDIALLESLLNANPGLVRGRSTRVTHFDPALHRSTLLHYVAANGVEGFRQRTPPNAVDAATVLLDAGAEVDALADVYGGQHTTMSLLVSSCHPARAGVQVALVDTLVDHGAAVEARGTGEWTSPLTTALVFGYVDAAEALVRRGARVDNIVAAAGLGRVDDARRLLASAAQNDRHRALALAVQNGQVDVVRLLLDAGENPDRYNPKGSHSHSTPLHQAVWSGHDSVVRLLIERGAKLDMRDTIYGGTPLGWAVYGGRAEIADYLRQHGATTGES